LWSARRLSGRLSLSDLVLLSHYAVTDGRRSKRKRAGAHATGVRVLVITWLRRDRSCLVRTSRAIHRPSRVPHATAATSCPSIRALPRATPDSGCDTTGASLNRGRKPNSPAAASSIAWKRTSRKHDDRSARLHILSHETRPGDPRAGAVPPSRHHARGWFHQAPARWRRAVASGLTPSLAASDRAGHPRPIDWPINRGSRWPRSAERPGSVRRSWARVTADDRPASRRRGGTPPLPEG
jgi:hypothetical protein